MLRAIGLVVLFSSLTGPAYAQTVMLSVDVERENFRAEPRGAVVAEVLQGTALEQVGVDGHWRQATLSGWIWAPSTRAEGRPGRLVVTADGGENLRDLPNGERVARVSEGTVLTELDRRDDWVRVERTAWIWDASVSEQTGPAGAAEGTALSGAAEATDDEAADSAAAPIEWIRAGPGGNPMLSAPDGDTLATLAPGSAMEVVAREGNWARVRLDGWIWEPSATTAADSGSVLKDLPAATIAAAPDRFRGRIVEWRVQFIALERAEKIRSDFYEGEPFILARAPGDDPTFVYIAVPPEKVEQVRRLSPLERVTILGRIRTGRSPLMDAPVLDLLELRRD